MKWPKSSTNNYGIEPVINENVVVGWIIVLERKERGLVQIVRAQLSRLINYHSLKRFIVNASNGRYNADDSGIAGGGRAMISNDGFLRCRPGIHSHTVLLDSTLTGLLFATLHAPKLQLAVQLILPQFRLSEIISPIIVRYSSFQLVLDCGFAQAKIVR